MATEQKDFKVKKGIVVGGNITTSSNGFLFDATANVLLVGGSTVALQETIDLVQSNVTNVTANLYNTYNTLDANDYSTILAAYSNDIVTLDAAYANDVATLDSAYANDAVTLEAAYANDTSTLEAAYANDIVTLEAAYANDTVTLEAAYANDIFTLEAAYANDIFTLELAYANDITTLDSAYANDVVTLELAYANDVTTLDTAYANDYATYSTLRDQINNVADNVASISTDIDTISSNVNTNAADIVTLNSNAASAASNSIVNATRLDSLKYFKTITSNGVNIEANANASSMSIEAGDGITIIANAETSTITIFSGASEALNDVQENVTALTANVDIVSSNVDIVSGNVDALSANVDSIIDGTTPFTGTVTMQQNLIVDGDLIVGGNTTSIASVDTVITDRILTLANGQPSGAFDSGLVVVRGSDANVFIGFDESADEFVIAYTSDPSSNTVDNITISSYANLHVDNITVDGLVDGVDIADLNSRVSNANQDLNTVSSNVDLVSSNAAFNTARFESLKYYQTIQVAGQSDVVASSNADTLTLVAGTGISLVTAADQITVGFTLRSDIDNVSSNVDAVTSNVNQVQSNLSTLISGGTAFTGDVTFNQAIAAKVAKLNTQLHVTSNVKTNVGTADTEIFNFPGSVYRGAELTILTQDVTNTEYQINKMLIVHDGEDVFFTEYGAVYTGANELATFNVAIDASDVISVRSVGGSANKKISVSSLNLIQ